MAQMVKNPLAMQEIWVQSLGWEDPLEKGNPTPPLPLTTAITFFTLLNAFCASSRLSGLLRLAQSAPQVEQSCVHSDTSFTSFSKSLNLVIMH